MSDGPLAPDCEALRQMLVANPLPSVWELDAAQARAMHRELSLAALPGWLPPLDELKVSTSDLAIGDGLPALRRYRAEPTNDSVCLVWLHGGGWVLGNLDTADPTARTACAATGWDVLSVDYRCAPDDPFPAAALDALAATDWALSNYDTVVVGGDSAGGNLAAVVARNLGAQPSLVGQVLVYPAVDPHLSTPSAHEFSDNPFLTRRDMEWFYDQYVPNHSDRADPLLDLVSSVDDLVGTPIPAVVLTVGFDPLRDEGIEYANRLLRNGGQVTWIHAPELFHGAFTQSGYLVSAAARVAEVWTAAAALVSSPV
jgi:acetyl esterase